MRLHKNQNQLLLVFLAVGFLIGIVYKNVISADDLVSTDFFSKANLEKYRQAEIITEKYLWYVVKRRVVSLGIICFLSCLRWKKALVVSCMLACGFMAGMLTVASVLQLGIMGIVLCAVGMLPQVIFYAFGYGILFLYWWNVPTRQWNYVKLVFVIIMFLAGMATEVYVNPTLVKMFLGLL